MCTFAGRETVQRLFSQTPAPRPGLETVIEELFEVTVNWPDFTSARVVEAQGQQIRQTLWPLAGVYGALWDLKLVTTQDHTAASSSSGRRLQIKLDRVGRQRLDSVYQVVVGVALENKQTGAFHASSRYFVEPTGFYHFDDFLKVDEHDLPDKTLIGRCGESTLNVYVRVDRHEHQACRLELQGERAWLMECCDLLLQISDYVEFEGATWRLLFFNNSQDLPELMLERRDDGEGAIQMEVEFMAHCKDKQHVIRDTSVYRGGDIKGCGDMDFANLEAVGFRVCSVSKRC